MLMKLSKHSNRDLGPVCADFYTQGKVMKKAIIAEATAVSTQADLSRKCSTQEWKILFEAALLEDNPDLFALRLQNARDAIVCEIEDSFDTASSSERRLLLAALNTISGLYEADSERLRGPRAIGHSA
jgi:hypothetical protein